MLSRLSYGSPRQRPLERWLCYQTPPSRRASWLEPSSVFSLARCLPAHADRGQTHLRMTAQLTTLLSSKVASQIVSAIVFGSPIRKSSFAEWLIRL